MKWLLFNIGIILTAFCTSCTKDLKLPDAKADKKIVLLGELVANESVYFRGGQSATAASSQAIVLELVNGLTVNLNSTNSGDITLSGNPDSLSNTLFTIPFISSHIISAGTKYTVTAKHTTLGTATVSVNVPAAFTATVTDTVNTRYAEEDVLEVTININDPASENYYVIEALKQVADVSGQFYFNNRWLNITDYKYTYDSLRNAGTQPSEKYDTVYHKKYFRHNVYTTDLNSENLKDQSSYTGFKRILLSDYNFSGKPYTTKVYIGKHTVVQPDSSAKGKVTLLVKSVSKEYFEYLKGYEGYDGNSGINNVSSAVNLRSNVQNGLGIIGGVYKQQFTYLFDKWEF